MLHSVRPSVALQLVLHWRWLACTAGVQCPPPLGVTTAVKVLVNITGLRWPWSLIWLINELLQTLQYRVMHLVFIHQYHWPAVSHWQVYCSGPVGCVCIASCFVSSRVWSRSCEVLVVELPLTWSTFSFARPYNSVRSVLPIWLHRPSPSLPPR